MTERAEPVRTCVGCRVRSAKSDLLRVVVAGDGTAACGVRLVPDPRGRTPGRGAHLHPSAECLALAERRRAFGRALRLDRPVDLSAVREWVRTRAVPGQAEHVKGEATTDERSMSQHR